MDFSHNTINELLEEHQKGKFDGEDGGPSQDEKNVKKCPASMEHLVELIRVKFGNQGWIVPYGTDQKSHVAFVVDDSRGRN